MKKEWNTIKHAIKPYKNLLDLRIDTNMQNPEEVTVYFFLNENATDTEYYIILKYQDSCWKGKLLRHFHYQ